MELDFDYNRQILLFLKNCEILKREFKWQNPFIRRSVALLYTMENFTVNGDMIRQRQEMIKRRTGTFSMFRQPLGIMVPSVFALRRVGETAFGEIMEVYGTFKKNGFLPSAYLVFASLVLVSGADIERLDRHEHTVGTAKEFLSIIKKQGRFQMGVKNYITSVAFALSCLQPDGVSVRLNSIYARLKADLFWGRPAREASHIFVLGGGDGSNDAVLSRKLLRLRDGFKLHGLNHYINGFFTALSFLALLPEEVNDINCEVMGVFNTLCDTPEIKSLYASRPEKFFYSAVFFINAYLQNTGCDFTPFYSDMVLSALADTAIILASSA